MPAGRAAREDPCAGLLFAPSVVLVRASSDDALEASCERTSCIGMGCKYRPEGDEEHADNHKLELPRAESGEGEQSRRM